MIDVVRMSVAERQPPCCGRAAEQRPADTPGENVVEVEMQLRHQTHTGAAGAVDGNDRLDTDLEVVADPDDAGVDRARRSDPGEGIVGDGPAELRLDDRYQMIDEIGQFEIDDVRLQVRHAVLHRAAVDEKVGIVGDVDFARGRVDGDGPGAGRDRV